MKSKRQLFVLFSSVFILCLISVSSTQAIADGNGGAVSTKGEIVLKESGITMPSSSATSSDSTTSPSDSRSTDTPIQKPKGRLPSTGELVRTSLLMSGVILFVIIILFYFRKRKATNGGADK